MSTTRAPRSKPRLLAILQLPPPIHGASTANAAVIQSHVVNSKFSVTIVRLDFASQLSELGRAGTRKALSMVRIALAIVREYWFRRPTLVYYNFSPTGWAMIRDAIYATMLKAFRANVVYHVHGSGIARSARHPIVRSILRWVLGGSMVVHLSPSLARELHGLVPPNACRILPNGVTGRSRTQATGMERSARDARTIVYLSNLLPEKGARVLIDALGLLQRRGVVFRAVLAGPAVNEAFSLECRKAVRSNGIEHQVRWVGACYGEAKDRVLGSGTIFAFPTYYPWEGVPLVILEAMSHEMAIVASDQGGIRDIIEDGVTGFLVPPRDSMTLALRLEVLLEDPSLQMAMGEAARLQFDRRHTLRHFEEGIADILEEAAARAGT